MNSVAGPGYESRSLSKPNRRSAGGAGAGASSRLWVFTISPVHLEPRLARSRLETLLTFTARPSGGLFQVPGILFVAPPYTIPNLATYGSRWSRLEHLVIRCVSHEYHIFHTGCMTFIAGNTITINSASAAGSRGKVVGQYWQNDGVVSVSRLGCTLRVARGPHLLLTSLSHCRAV